ncbi:MAG: hypothetical protein JST54_28245 [Deltaproteobacteria bacterium]|nr:hypothetical protein [Deltaproteobacteria bacterium]
MAAKKAKKKGAKKAAKKATARKAAPKKAKAAKKPAKKAAPKKAAPKKVAKKAVAKKPAPKKAKPAKKPAPKAASAKAEKAQSDWEARPKHRVEVDEIRERDGERDAAFVNRADKANDDLAEELGESFVTSATSGEEAGMDMANEETEEEKGGPFVETTADQEFADDVDESNPEDAEPAALPTTASSESDEEE